MFNAIPSAIGQAAAQAAVSSVITQGIGVATGLQKKFSWTAVAASAVGAGIGRGVSDGLAAAGLGNNLDDVFGIFARETLSSLANGAAQALVSRQQPDWSLIAAQSVTQGALNARAEAGNLQNNESRTKRSEDPSPAGSDQRSSGSLVSTMDISGILDRTAADNEAALISLSMQSQAPTLNFTPMSNPLDLHLPSAAEMAADYLYRDPVRQGLNKTFEKGDAVLGNLRALQEIDRGIAGQSPTALQYGLGVVKDLGMGVLNQVVQPLANVIDLSLAGGGLIQNSLSHWTQGTIPEFNAEEYYIGKVGKLAARGTGAADVFRAGLQSSTLGDVGLRSFDAMSYFRKGEHVDALIELAGLGLDFFGAKGISSAVGGFGRGVTSSRWTVKPYSGDPLSPDFMGPLDLNMQATRNVGNVTAPIDFDGHILSGELKANGSVVGGHSTVSGNVRVVPGTESVPNAQGVYQAKIEIPDPANPGQWLPKTNNGGISTLFPDSWTADRIKVEVNAAYLNRVINGNRWTGVTPSGVSVQGWLTPKTTVYPIH